MPQQAATAFSWALKLNFVDIALPFGNIRFSGAIDGFGVSGVATGQFEVDVYDEDNYYGEALLDNATLQLFETHDYCLPSKKYYVSKRSIDNKVCRFTAYDILSRTDQAFDISGIDYVDENAIACTVVLSAIKEQCGFTAISSTGSGLEHINFKLDELKNKTCRALLEMVAEAMAGVWIAECDDSVILSCLGAEHNPLFGMVDAKYYTEINYQGRQKITGVVFTNSETGNVNTLKTGEYGIIINIESPFVANGTGLDEVVWGRIQDYEYQAWNCEKALIDELAIVSSQIHFGNGVNKQVNNVSLSVDNTGIYFSGGCPPQDEEQWKYREYLDRAKLSIDKLVGHTKVTSTGRIEFVNKNK